MSLNRFPVAEREIRSGAYLGTAWVWANPCAYAQRSVTGTLLSLLTGGSIILGDALAE